ARPPVAGSVYAVALPPSVGRATSTRTGVPLSASLVAAASPAQPPPITIASITREHRTRPQLDRDQRAVGTRHTDPAAEDVIARALDPPKNLEIDGAHDLGRQQASAVDRRQRRRGLRIVEARPLAFEPHQPAHSGRQPPGAEVVLGDAEARHVLGGDVDALLAKVGR